MSFRNCCCSNPQRNCPAASVKVAHIRFGFPSSSFEPPATPAYRRWLTRTTFYQGGLTFQQNVDRVTGHITNIGVNTGPGTSVVTNVVSSNEYTTAQFFSDVVAAINGNGGLNAQPDTSLCTRDFDATGNVIETSRQIFTKPNDFGEFAFWPTIDPATGESGAGQHNGDVYNISCSQPPFVRNTPFSTLAVAYSLWSDPLTNTQNDSGGNPTRAQFGGAGVQLTMLASRFSNMGNCIFCVITNQTTSQCRNFGSPLIPTIADVISGTTLNDVAYQMRCPSNETIVGGTSWPCHGCGAASP